jgi:hypothetical protein
MDNDNTEPVFTVGTLPKKCYTDPQELLNDFAAALSVPTDNAKVIKGAEGPPGPVGGRGPAGPAGPPGEMLNKNLYSVEIQAGATTVDIPVFEGWQSAHYQVLYNGYDEHPTEDDFTDLGVVIGVGTIVPVYAVPNVIFIRVHLTFQGGPTTVPDDKFLLNAVSFL